MWHALYNGSMKHIKLKIKKQNNQIFLLAVILFLVPHILTGCIPDNFTKEERKAFLQEAGEVASSYLSDRYSGAVIQKIRPETTAVDMKRELTEFASGQFVWQEQTYNFTVNAETGEVYTSVYFDEIKERLMEVLLQELGVDGEETAIEECAIFYLKGDKRIGRDCFMNVFTEEESVEKLLEKILQDTETYQFYIRLQYKGDDLSLEMMEMEAPFPTLSGVSIYHVAEEHALCEEEYSILILPSLSKEILVLDFDEDTASYTRYQTLEQDGLSVLYNAYERTRKQDMVTESVITEDDIVLTVADEFIRLDCTKDNYSMYLSTKDKKIAKKYRYVFLSSSGFNEKRTEKGMWYSFEDGYVYADSVYSKVPYEIQQYYYEGNVIYSRPQKK